MKFFASLVLLGFLLGLMIGRALEPERVPAPVNHVQQVQTYQDGLALCLARPAQVQATVAHGAYQLVFQNTVGQSAQGELFLAQGEPVRWRLVSQEREARLVFIGLQPVLGRWQPRSTDTQWCVDIQISLLDPSPEL